MKEEHRCRSIPVTFSTGDADEEADRPPPLLISTPPHKWHYASLSSALDLGHDGSSDPVLVKVVATVHSGPVGIALLSMTDISRLITPECVLEASGTLQEATFLVNPEEPCRVVVRTAGIDRAGEVQIEGIYLGDDPSLLREREVNSFAHWYYTVDFGDGFIRHATVANEPSWSRACAIARSIFSHLITTSIGPIDERTLLDVACSAGHYSLFFARMGAHVHGFDHDATAIAQARVVAKYSDGGRPGSVEFSVSDLDDCTAPAPFDIVFCSGLFYHLKNPLAGAQKLSQLSSRWLVLQSCVSDRSDAVFELSDPARWPFCADWEYCLVPSGAMVQEVFQRVGLRIRAAHRRSDFIFDPVAESVALVSEGGRGESIERLGSPIYLVLEKA